MKSFLLFLLLAPLALFAQNAKIDSLKRVIETTKVDTVKGRTLCKLCSRLTQAGELEGGYKEGRKGLSILQKARDLRGQFSCLNKLGQNRMAAGDYQSCLEIQQQRFDLSEKTGNDAEAARSMLDAGNVLHQQGNLDKALDYVFKALRFCEKTKDLELAAKCYNSIGIVFYSKEDMTNALKYYQKSLDLKVQLGDLEGQVSTLSNMANIYSEQKEHHRAIQLYERSLATLKKSGDVINQGMVLINLALSQKALMQFDAAVDNMKAGLAILEKAGHRAGESVALGNLGLLYIDTGQPVKARAYAGRSFAISREVGHMEFTRFSAEILYKADSMLGNWKGAFEAHQIFKSYSDSLKNDERSQEIGRLEAEYEADKEREVLEERQAAELTRRNWMTGSAFGGIALSLVIAYTLFRGKQKEKRANAALWALNKEVVQQKSEIEAINAELHVTLEEVSRQKKEIEVQHEKIEDSIRYASRIQGAILPDEAQLKEILPRRFIHYQPRDIVSGDFYWMTRLNGRTFFAAVDCTGHGVPGAFMSVLGSNLLHQIVDENQITEPDVVLAELDRRISQTLRQQFGGDSKDGMDAALIVLHDPGSDGNQTVEYAGAGRPCWHLQQGVCREHNSAKYSCGGSQHFDKQYPACKIEARPGDRLFVFSDGATDQFGGPNGRKLGSKALQAFLTQSADLPIERQGEAFARFFSEWMEGRKQLDDVLLIGIEI